MVSGCFDFGHNCLNSPGRLLPGHILWGVPVKTRSTLLYPERTRPPFLGEVLLMHKLHGPTLIAPKVRCCSMFLGRKNWLCSPENHPIRKLNLYRLRLKVPK